MKEFQELGALVEGRWKDENYNEQLFPDIAAQALIESDLPARVGPWEIIRWVHTTPALPEQHDVEGRFGNPPVTLFSGPRFYIDVYYWLDGTTSIHQHAFTGAFQVLLGSSVHSSYSFREDRVINEHFSIGELSLNEVHLLKQRDVRTIIPGRQFIHSLFHLDRPSATITIRTAGTPSAAVQYDYRKPYFALNPFFRNASLTKKQQTVGLLLGMKHPEADAMIGDLVCTSDFHTAYIVLTEMFHHLKHNQMDALFGLSSNQDRFMSILERCRSVHGQITDLVLPVLEEQERQHDIIFRRASITTEEHRFFLALLLNVPSRMKIFQLVHQRFPEQDPFETVLDWVDKLSTTRVFGSNEANVLGIEDFDEFYSSVFEQLLRGQTAQDIKVNSAREFSDLEGDALAQRVDATIKNLRKARLFKSILSD